LGIFEAGSIFRAGIGRWSAGVQVSVGWWHFPGEIFSPDGLDHTVGDGCEPCRYGFSGLADATFFVGDWVVGAGANEVFSEKAK